MKRLILTLTLVASVIAAQAQELRELREKNQRRQQHTIEYYNNAEVSVGFGALSNIIGGFAIALNGIGGSSEPYKIDHNYSSIPSINLSYGRQLTPLMNLGATVSYSHVKSDVVCTATDTKAGYVLMGSFSVIPTMRFDWLRRDFFRCYSRIGIGVANYIDSKVYYDFVDDRDSFSDNTILPYIDCVPFGITAGRKLYGLAEVSVGAIGFLKLGAGVRF